MKKTELLTYLMVFILVSLFVITHLLIRRIPVEQQFETNRLVPIYKDKPVLQTITPSRDGLSTILVFLKNRMLINTQPLEFKILDGDRQIREIKLSGANVSDGATFRFQFAPIFDSKGKTYRLLFLAPETRREQVPIEVGFSNNDTYPNGSSVTPNEQGDISFQLFYKPKNLTESVITSMTNIFLGVHQPLFVLTFCIWVILCLALVKNVIFHILEA